MRAVIMIGALILIAATTAAGLVVSSFRSPVARVYGIDCAAGGGICHVDGGAEDRTYVTNYNGSILASYPMRIDLNALDLDIVPFSYAYTCNALPGVYTLDGIGGSVLRSWRVIDTAHGVATNGTYIWISARNRIYRYTTAGALLDSFPGPWLAARGVDFGNGYLWVADRGGGGTAGGTLYQVTTGGSVVTSFKRPNHNVYGIAFYGSYIWYTNERDNYVYRIKYTGPAVVPASLGRVKATYQ